MSQRNYYEAYDDRYRQIHSLNLHWFALSPSPIVSESLKRYAITEKHKILELGCGEGRDAFPLIKQGYDLLATDISPEAIRFCREQMPQFARRFQILDCVTDKLNQTFDFIYAVAVVHMLVPDEDRLAFYRFIRAHLSEGGYALICTMGNGETEFQSDIRNAFDLQPRFHGQTGLTVNIASTSCRVVSFPTFRKELETNRFTIAEMGLTSSEPDFTQLMYAIVK